MILYLHGFASGPASRKARYFQERLAARGTDLLVPAMDEGNFRGLTVTGQLQLLERLAGGKPVTLIGSSMGGYIATLYASRHPETEKLVLLAPAFGFTHRWPESLDEATLRQWQTSGALLVHHYAAGEMREVGYQLIEDGNRYEDYPDFDQPALILHGSHDDVVPLAYSKQFAATHPNVELKVLDSNHELTNVLEEAWTEAERFLFAHC